MTMQAVVSADPLNVFAQTPFMRLLGMQRDYSSRGKAQMSLEPNADFGNVIGAVHGGVVVTLLDVVMASAAVSIMDFGKLIAQGQVVQHDQDLAWCTAQVYDAQGRKVAQAQASFRYLPRPE
jgi:YD repeat-containing protein